jgi:hypothetical protein
MAGLGIVVSDQVRTDAYGSWNPLTLTDDATVLTIDDSVLAADLNRTYWDDGTLRRVWTKTANFLVSEWLDSELVWDDTVDQRAAVTARIEDSGFAGAGSAGQTAGLESLTTGQLPWGGSFPYGSIVLDQDFNGWRQSGTLLPFDEGSGALSAQAFQALLQSRIVATQPRAYELGQPRTLVEDLALTAVQPTGSPDAPWMADFTVTVTYHRPVNVAGVDIPLYESSNFDLTLRLLTGWPTLIEFRGFSWGRRDNAVLGHGPLQRLPQLAAAAGTTDLAGPRQALGHVSFSLPDSATPVDTPCDSQIHFSSPDLEIHHFQLGPASDLIPGCLTARTWARQDPWGWWHIQPGTTTWSFASGPLTGGIDISQTSYGDEVSLEFDDPDGLSYAFQATVPTGSGQAVAASLAASVAYTPPASGTTTPQDSATP